MKCVLLSAVLIANIGISAVRLGDLTSPVELVNECVLCTRLVHKYRCLVLWRNFVFITKTNRVRQDRMITICIQCLVFELTEQF